MEKTLSPDERIKRAEEIYYRKRMQSTNRKSATVNVSSKKEFSMFKKMILQISICILIYGAFYIMQNTNYIFSEDAIKKINDILSYDINIKHLYEQGMQYINSFTDSVGADDSVRLQNAIESNTINETESNEKVENENTVSTEENIGGENIKLTEENKEEKVELTQMEKDAKDILENKSLIIPLKGTITSRYGIRNPETPTVPKNHTGIDIAANEGTVFVASMSGTVEKVSSERRVRKSFYNCK